LADPAYVAGDHWVLCDECGFKTRASQTRMRWDNLRVCLDDWEPRHPQDFVRGKKDEQRVPNARPEPTDVFLELNQVTEDNLTGAPVDRILTPAAAAVSYIGHAPVLPIFVASASVTYSSAAPTLVVDDLLRPAAASITYTGHAPNVAAGATVKPAAANVTYSGQAPQVYADIILRPAAAAVTYAGAVPSVVVDDIIKPDAASVTYSSTAPSVIVDRVLAPASASVTYAGQAPTLLISITAQPASASITYAGQTPTVLNGDIMVDGTPDQYVDESGNVYGIV